jgi:hypothetical protein
MDNAYRAFMGNTEGKIPFGKSMSRWEYTVKIDLKYM